MPRSKSSKKITAVTQCRSGSPTVDELASPVRENIENEVKTNIKGNRKVTGISGSSFKSNHEKCETNKLCSSSISETVTVPKAIRASYHQNDEFLSVYACKDSRMDEEADITSSPTKLKRLKINTSPSLLQYDVTPSQHSVTPKDYSKCKSSPLSGHNKSPKHSTPISGPTTQGLNSRKKTPSRKRASKKIPNNDDVVNASDTSFLSLAASVDVDIFHYDTVAMSSNDESKCRQSVDTFSLKKPTTAEEFQRYNDARTHNPKQFVTVVSQCQNTSMSQTNVRNSTSELERSTLSPSESCKKRGRKSKKDSSHDVIEQSQMRTMRTKENVCGQWGFIEGTSNEINNHKLGHRNSSLVNNSSENGVKTTDSSVNLISHTYSSWTDKEKAKNGTAKKYRKRQSRNNSPETVESGSIASTSGVGVKIDKARALSKCLSESVSSETDMSIDYDRVFEEPNRNRKNPSKMFRTHMETTMTNQTGNEPRNGGVNIRGSPSTGINRVTVKVKEGLCNSVISAAENPSSLDKLFGLTEVPLVAHTQKHVENCEKGIENIDESTQHDVSLDSTLNTSFDWLKVKEGNRQSKWKTVKKYCKRKSISPKRDRNSDSKGDQLQEASNFSNEEPEEKSEPAEIINRAKRDGILLKRTPRSKKKNIEETTSTENRDDIPPKRASRGRKSSTEKTALTESFSEDTVLAAELTAGRPSRKRGPAGKSADGVSSRKKSRTQSSDTAPQPVDKRTQPLGSVKRPKRGRKKRRNTVRLDPDVFGEPSLDGTEALMDSVAQVPTLCHSSVSTSEEEPVLAPEETSSSDEDLPVFSTYDQTGLDFLVKGAVVWVKCARNPYWPALVSKIYKKKTKIDKVSVMFVENGRINRTSGIAVTYKPGKVLPFNLFGDHSKYTEFKEAGIRCSVSFEESFNQVEAFLWHKAQGKEVEPFRYFQDADYDLPEYSEKISPENCENQPTETENSGSPVREVQNTSASSPPKVESPEHMQRHLEPFVMKRILQNQALVDFIKTDCVKEHLMKIYHGKESSSLHALYKKENKTREERLKLKFGRFGPIVDEMQEEELSEVLMNFAQSTDLLYYEKAPYVFSVWIPEAIVFAIQKVKRQSKAKAWETFYKLPRLSKREKQRYTEDLMNSKSTIDPEDQYRYKLSRERCIQTTMQCTASNQDEEL